jgi:hypothetical protein
MEYVVEQGELSLADFRRAPFELLVKLVDPLHDALFDLGEELGEHPVREFPKDDLAGERNIELRLSNQPL